MNVVHRLFPVTCIALLLAAGALDSAPTRDPAPTIAFGGSGGTLPPVPPLAGSNLTSQAPCDPTLTTPGSGPVLLQVVSRGQRVAVLRSTRGRLLAVALTDEAGRVLFPAVPTDGALLDVLGSDSVGLPVAPWSRVIVVAD